MAEWGAMAPTQETESQRFDRFVEQLSQRCGHADRCGPLRAYLTGLMLPGDRKSVEPMAARIEPRRVMARHQSMHHFVANAPWDDHEVLGAAVDYTLAELERHGPVSAWIVDDTGIPKKGKHSVGVARQYCGLLGKQDNCQVVVSVSVANQVLSIPVAYQLYLPEEWAQDPTRRKAAGVPDDVVFLPKWRIALNEIRRLLADLRPRAPVLADAGYGDTTAFRDEIADMGLSYAVGVKGGTSIWPPGLAPLPPRQTGERGRPATRLRRDDTHQPITIDKLAHSLPNDSWKTVRWQEGTKGPLRSRFAYVRVRTAHRDFTRSTPRDEEWLLIEWPAEEKTPTKYWLSNVPESTQLEDLVRLAKLRWRVERDYEEMKSEFGLDHFEGRGWRGFHHHGVLSIAAYCFLAAERARLSPPQPIAFLKAAPVPRGFRPRGASRKTRTA